MENKKGTLTILLEDYKEIQRRRELWSNVITSRDRLFFPLAIAIFAFLGTRLPAFITMQIEHFAFVWGGILLFILLGVWRGLSIHVDRHIVMMYEDEVKKEKELNYHSRTQYIYENLSKRSREHIAKLMGRGRKEIENYKYEQFAETCKSIKRENYETHYDYIVAALQTHRYCSVGSRGHWIWHLSAISLIILWIAMSLWWITYKP